MYPFYQSIKEDVRLRKLQCDDLLFVEYRCVPSNVYLFDIWTEHPCIIMVTSGKKKWMTPEGNVIAKKGDALFFKKGLFKLKNFYEEEYCALIFFLPECFIKDTILEFQDYLTQCKSLQKDFQMAKINMDEGLEVYFDNILNNVFQSAHPSKLILKLKFKELILQILTSKVNLQLRDYFMSTLNEDTNNLKRIMEANFLSNLPLEGYAKLCCRSLSSFKRDFYEAFGKSPGKWLTDNRLKFARTRLLHSADSINEIAFQSGFETTSHFIRCFRKKYGLPPMQFRLQAVVKANEKEEAAILN